MARHAKSVAAKRVHQQQAEASLYHRAIDLYQAELQKPKGEKWLGLQAVCTLIEDLHYDET